MIMLIETNQQPNNLSTRQYLVSALLTVGVIVIFFVGPIIVLAGPYAIFSSVWEDFTDLAFYVLLPLSLLIGGISAFILNKLKKWPFKKLFIFNTLITWAASPLIFYFLTSSGDQTSDFSSVLFSPIWYLSDFGGFFNEASAGEFIAWPFIKLINTFEDNYYSYYYTTSYLGFIAYFVLHALPIIIYSFYLRKIKARIFPIFIISLLIFLPLVVSWALDNSWFG